MKQQQKQKELPILTIDFEGKKLKYRVHDTYYEQVFDSPIYPNTSINSNSIENESTTEDEDENDTM